MDHIYDNIPKNQQQNIVYPFNIEIYLKEKREVYNKMTQKLIDGFAKEFIIKSDNEFCEICQYTVKNFIYALTIRGWYVNYEYGINKENLGHLGDNVEYYIRFEISSPYKSKL